MKITILIVLVSYLSFGCNESVVKTNVPQSSYNIAHSKENKVFITSYKPMPSLLKFNDATHEIDEVWVEYLWSYKDLDKNVLKESEKNIYLKFKDDNLDIYDFDLLNGLDFSKKGGVTGNKLTLKVEEITDFLKFGLVHKKDTIIINLKKNG